MIQKICSLLCGVVLAAGLAAVGYWMLFSNFAVYDDEGYILISVREYFAHGGLYETVYSQYGPAFYVFLDLIQHALGSPVGHTIARLLTLGAWLGTGISCAWVVWRHTAALSLALFTLAATFLYLYFVTDEPFHPGSLIFFLIAGSVWLTTECLRAGRLTAAALVCGVTGAILVLTKINVGAFYILAVVGWAGLQSGSRRGQWAVPILLTVFAAVLMHALIHEPWIQVYLTLFAVGAIALTLIWSHGAPVQAASVGWFVGAGVFTGLLIPACVWLRGTSPAGLLEGILLGPLRHPSSYSFPVDWRPGTLVVALLSLGLALAYPWARRRFSDPAVDRIIVALRLTQAAALMVAFALLLHGRVIGAVFSYVAPLLWIWIVPLRTIAPVTPAQLSPVKVRAPSSPTARLSAQPSALSAQPDSVSQLSALNSHLNPTSHLCRGLISMILLLQYLHAFPVGGSQESWGTFLIFPLAALGLGEVRDWFASRDATRRWAWPTLASSLLAIVAVKVGAVVNTTYHGYASQKELNLPGGADLHLPEAQRTTYRILTLNAVVHSDYLFSAPGLFSFNLWSGLPAPTGKNTTLWFALLNDADQQETIAALERSPRAGIIFQENLLQLLPAQNILPKGALWDYLCKNFRPAFRTDGFAYWVRAGRTIAPLNLAEFSHRAESSPVADLPDTQVEFCLVHDGRPIGRIELRNGPLGHEVAFALSGANTQAKLVAVNREGKPVGAPAAAGWPLQAKGLIRVSLRFNLPANLPLTPKAILYLRGVQGEDLGEVRIGE